jgi:hypothetical protein
VGTSKGNGCKSWVLRKSMIGMPRSPRDHDWSNSEELLRIHRLHVGVYNRVAAKLGVHVSLVSRLAKETRRSEQFPKR